MKKIGFTASTFDLLHAGHIQMLQEAKSQCDYLICGLHIDPSKERECKVSPVQTIVERYTQLNAVKYVDEIIPYESELDLIDLLRLYPIDVRILGNDYKDKKYTGKDIAGIEIYFNHRDHRFSTTSLRSEVIHNVDENIKNQRGQ